MTTLGIILIVVAFGIGALITYLIMRAKQSVIREQSRLAANSISELQQRLEDSQQEISLLSEQQQKANINIGVLQKELEIKEHQTTEFNDQIAGLQKDVIQQREIGNAAKIELGRISKEVETAKETIAERDRTIATQRNEIDKLQACREEQMRENSKITAERDTAKKEIDILKEQMQKTEKERATMLDKELQMAKEQIRNTTQEILKQREESLHKTNNEQMTNVVTPLKEQLEAIQKQVTETIKTSTDNKASLEKAIEDLIKRTVEIGNDANNLATALKNNTKTQGNWGELILEKLLENSGLIEGTHYDRQSTLKDAKGNPVFHDETGKRLIPDIIIHYPDSKDCIIDSKVSLNAYLDYCNAENETQQNEALKRHIESVRKHVKELARKDYSAYIQPPRQRLNYTIMFIPNETASQLALCNDHSLWREAFDIGVFITSEQNLLALLRMIQLSWTQVQQARNQQEVIDKASKLLSRVADFVERFEKIGETIDKSKKVFDSAKNKLYDGNQSIIKAAKEMEQLGYHTDTRREIPEPADWRQ